MANALTDPPFAGNPPVKLNVNAKILGLVIGIIAVVFAVFDLIGLLAALGFSGLCPACGFPFLWLLGSLLLLVGDILVAVGGFRMYQQNPQGKVLVAYGLALAVVAQLLSLIGTFLAYSHYAFGVGSFAIVGFIFWLIIRFIVYYLVVISRFPGQAPLVARAGSYGGGGYGGGSPPPPAGGTYGGGSTPPPPPSGV